MLLANAGRASWSPDGKRIAFDRWGRRQDIYIATLGGLPDRVRRLSG